MSATEKHVVQIFQRTKRIIDQARQQCHLWEHHISPKLILDGILPPPWLCNDALHSLASDPKELNKDGVVSEVLLSQPHFRVPFPGHNCSQYSNVDVVSEDVQFPICLHNKDHATKQDHNADCHSNLPDCSVNEAGCASSGPPQLNSGVISPQNQIEPRVSDSYCDPAVSLAKLQRSKSRQKALELRNSAKAYKRLSGDGNNAGVCAGTVTGSPSPILQADQIMESDLVNDFQCNIESCSIEEVRRGDCQTQTDNKSEYLSRITRSKSLSEKFNSLKVASSSRVKEDGPLPNNLNEPLELANRSSFMNGTCGVGKAKKGEYQSKEAGSSVNDQSLTKTRSSSQARCNNELKSDCTLGRGNDVQVSEQSCTNVELVDLSKASDCNYGRRTYTVEDGDFLSNKQECDTHGSLRLYRSACPPTGDGVLVTGGYVKSIDQSVQSSQHLISHNSHHLVGSVVGSFGGQQDPDFCAEKTIENLGRSYRGKVYMTRDSKSPNHVEEMLKSLSWESLNPGPAELDTLSPSPKHFKLDIETATSSAEKQNIVALAAYRNTGAETFSVNEGPLRPVCSSILDGRSLHAESLCIEIAVAEKVLNAQETTLSGANPVDNVRHRSAKNIAKVDTDFDALVEKDPSCSGSRHTSVIRKSGLNASALRLPTDFAVSVMRKQLDFDDVEETNMNGISSPDLKEGQQGMSPEEKPLDLFKPVNLQGEESSIVCQGERNSFGEMRLLKKQEVPIRGVGSPKEQLASHFKEPNISGEMLTVLSANKELPVVHNELLTFTSSLINNSSPSQVAGDNSSRGLSKEVISSKFISANRELKNDEHSTNLEDSFSAAVTGNGLLKYTDGNVDLGQQGSNSISLGRNGDLLRQAVLSDGKIIGFPTKSFTNDLERSSPQHKRRKTDDGVQCTGECQTIEGSSLKVRKEEKLILDGRDRTANTLLLAEPNLSSFIVDSTMKCIIEEKLEAWHHQESCGQECAEHRACVERSSSKIIYPGGNANVSDVMSDSPGIPCLDLVGTGEALPEFEGFIMQTGNTQPSTARDQMDLEEMNLSGNLIDYSSLGKSRFMHSPLCYSSTPYKLHKIPDVYKSLPNGLLEGIGLRTSFPPNDGCSRSLSDCLPSFKSQSSSIQTFWDRINLNLGSSGKLKSLKLELPCISEENENVDEIAGTFQTGVGSEGMTDSITREPLAEIIDNAKPSTSVIQQDILTGGCEDFVSTKLNFTGTHNKVTKKFDMPDGNSRRFTSKGKENQNNSLGANGIKRTAESVRKRSSRPKLSGKVSMKQGLTNSVVMSKGGNIVSNVTSFIPLVQQKQAAAVVAGKRDIKVKALEAAEAAKRMAEKKENERKMKKEALKLEREKLEQQNLKQMELQKKKKEEERKKKEAEMAARKRQREDEDKKEKERKRKRVNDTKKQQQEHEKIHAKKEAIEIQCRATDGEVQENNKFMDERGNHNHVEKISETEQKDSCTEHPEPVNNCANNGKVMGNLIKATDHDLIIKNALEEQSYEISPYKGSDDEDEDEDDMPNNKFIPSWASKHRLSLAVQSQKMDPERIFPLDSFCNLAEVLRPRKLQI